MIELFEKIIEMSLYGSIVILFTVLLRFILRKSSKRLMMILWAAVAVRLLVPVSIESSMSLFNHIPLGAASVKGQIFESGEKYAEPDTSAVFSAGAEEKSSDTNSDDAVQKQNINTAVPAESGNVTAKTAVNTGFVLSCVWLAGAAVIAVYCVICYVMLKKRIAGSVEEEPGVFLSPGIASPFVFGFVKPAIYLPDTLCDAERGYILLHERTHIRRGDWLYKMLGMAAVAIHWFNPLVWLGYMLFECDLEMSCDEKTIENMDENLKKAYSRSLVSFAGKTRSKRYILTPLAFSGFNFSKSEVTNRVKNILNYKKGSRTVLALTAVLLLVFSTACSLNAKTDNETSNIVENRDTADTAVENTDTSGSDAAQTDSVDQDKVYSSDSKAYVNSFKKNYNMAIDTEAFVSNIPETLTAAGYENTEITKKEFEGFVQYSFNSIKREDALHKNCLEGCAEVYESADTAEDVFVSRVKAYTGSVPEEKNGISLTHYEQSDSYGTCKYTTVCRKDNCVMVLISAMVVGPTGSKTESTGKDIAVDLKNYEKILNDNGIAYSIPGIS